MQNSIFTALVKMLNRVKKTVNGMTNKYIAIMLHWKLNVCWCT